MILESYDRYEFKLLECNGLTPTRFVQKLNELGNEGWKVVQSYGSLFTHSFDEAKVLLERKIICTKVEEI